MKYTKPKYLALVGLAILVFLIILWLPHATSPDTQDQSQAPSRSGTVVRAPAQSVTTEQAIDAISGSIEDDDSSDLSAHTDDAITSNETMLSFIAPVPVSPWDKMVPPLRGYIEQLPAEHRPAFATFQAKYPEADPTDNPSFAGALLQERGGYGMNLTDDTAALFHSWIQDMEAMSAALIHARAKHSGLRLRGVASNGSTYFLSGFDGARPLYLATTNAAAAVSTGVNFVRANANYDPPLGATVNGAGLYVNVMDVGAVHYNNVEFQLPGISGSRVIYVEGEDYPGAHAHATHVAGTIGALGKNPSLMGMVPHVWIRSHLQQYAGDITLHGARWPGQPHPVINPRTGQQELKSVMGNASMGPDTIVYDYTNYSALFDIILRDYPYYSFFVSAGNKGSSLSSLAGEWKSCKNIIVMGSVSDAYRDSSGVLTSGGVISGFSSRGPTYDGRIKPDFVANGDGLNSPTSNYGSGSMQGTSMSSPNAAGSATLLMDYLRKKIPGHYARSSTVRALMMNSADDLGNPGPDYTHGWGLINIKAAADIVKQYAEDPASRVIVEDTLASGQTWTQSYTANGGEPIQVSLAWIDPAGVGNAMSSKITTPVLVNDLNVRLIASDGTEYMPYVMPFTTGVGSTPALSSSLRGHAATTGNNVVDNNEQVFIAAPPAGNYTVQINHSGMLQGDAPQPFSIAITGMAATAPLAPEITAVTPPVGNVSNDFLLSVHGSGFVFGSDVFLRRPELPEVKAHGVIVVGSKIECRINSASMAKGAWDVIVRAPDGTENLLPRAFLLPVVSRDVLYSNYFENGSTGLALDPGWSLAAPNKINVGGIPRPTIAQEGSRSLVTYPSQNYPNDVSIYATLPAISTVGYANVQLEFQRWLGLSDVMRAGDRADIEYSLDGTTWAVIDSLMALRDPAWTLQRYDLPPAVHNQPSVQLRFSLHTDQSFSSIGWSIDSLRLTAQISNHPLPPSFSSTPVTSVTTGGNYHYAISTTDPDTNAASLALSASGLPAGLTFTADHQGGGVISGVAADSGAFPMTLSVTDGIYTEYQVFTLLSFPADYAPPVIATNSLADGYVGEAYQAAVHATGHDFRPLTLALLGKPHWLNFVDNGDGTADLSGMPGTTETIHLTIIASDGLDSTVKSLNLTVHVRAAITTPSLPQASVGRPYNTMIHAVSSNAPLSLSVAGKPAWLAFQDHGNGIATLSGTPTETGTINLTFIASDQLFSQDKTLVLVVNPGSVVLNDTFESGTGDWFKGTASGTLGTVGGQLSWLESGDNMAEVIGRSFPKVTLAEGQTIRLSFDYRQNGGGTSSNIFRVGLYDVTTPVSANNWLGGNMIGPWRGFSTFIRDNSTSSNLSRIESGSTTSVTDGPFRLTNSNITVIDISPTVVSQFNINDNGTVTYQCVFEITHASAGRMDSLFTLSNTTNGVTTTHFSIPGTTGTTYNSFNTIALRYTNNPMTLFFDNVMLEVITPAEPSPEIFSDWQELTWPGVTDPAIVGVDQDPDGDGMSNLMEWALHLDPTKADSFRPAMEADDTSIQFTYTRRKTAPGEATFAVEWSDTLGNDWTSEGVATSAPVSLDETSESVGATIPPGPNGRRFVRVRVEKSD